MNTVMTRLPDACRLFTMTILLVVSALLSGCSDPSSNPAIDLDEKYRTINTSPLRNTEAARRDNTLGLEHMDKGELYQAEMAFKRAIESDVSFGPAHNNLGKIYFLKRSFYLAAHEFDDAIKLMPSHAGPHNNLGLTLIEANKLDDAIESLRKATSLDPHTIDYQANLARALIQRGDRSEEVITLLRAIATRDERVQWRVWASHQLGEMGLDAQ